MPEQSTVSVERKLGSGLLAVKVRWEWLEESNEWHSVSLDVRRVDGKPVRADLPDSEKIWRPILERHSALLKIQLEDLAIAAPTLDEIANTPVVGR
jgi:hypothetical protein